MSKHLHHLDEKYPHITKQIRLFWGKPGFEKIVHSICMDTRENTRRGFPHADMDVIMLICEEHRTEFPHLDVLADWSTLDFETTKFLKNS